MKKSLLKHLIPRKMVDAPHQIHLDGVLMQPGADNDYTVERINKEDAILSWWNNLAAGNPEVVVSITQLNTGERWAWTQKTGVFVDTRRLK